MTVPRVKVDARTPNSATETLFLLLLSLQTIGIEEVPQELANIRTKRTVKVPVIAFLAPLR